MDPLRSGTRPEPRVEARPRLVAAPRRLRVCQVMSADLWAGAEVQLATVASYLVERGDIELSAVLFNEGELAVELRRLGVAVTIIDERENGALAILASLTRWLRTHPVDIVHTHRGKDTVLGAVAARFAGASGVVRTVHGLSEPWRGWRWLKNEVYEAIDGLTLRCLTDRIVVVSQRMAEGHERSGYPAEKVIAIPNGVHLERVRPARMREEVRLELGIGPAVPLIGTVGRLSPVKGHAHFLEAARLILQREPRARFLVVGDGPLRDQLERTARALGIGDACAFVGARPDVYDLVAAMDVFVLSSLGEGIPMALLEAMALGTPVVATAVGGVPEVVAHRATGLLVASGDEPGLAEACLELARDPGKARTLAARARRAAEQSFSHERNGAALCEVYRGITGDPGGRGRRGVRSRLVRFARRVRGAVAVAITLRQRRRMEHIRREPGPLVTALRSAKRILIVCHGNIIRSPFTARLVAQTLGDDRRVSISSVGLAARPGTPSPPAAVLAARRRRVELGDHVAATITREAVAASDVVFVMDIPQLRAMRKRFRRDRAKMFLLACLAPALPLEVRDPFGGDDASFQECFDHISACVRPIVRRLAEGAAR